MTGGERFGEVGVEIRKRCAYMRKPVQAIYDRQLARCLTDIEALYKLPEMVIDRIKRAISYTAKDVDKLNNKESGNGIQDQDESRFNR